MSCDFISVIYSRIEFLLEKTRFIFQIKNHGQGAGLDKWVDFIDELGILGHILKNKIYALAFLLL